LLLDNYGKKHGIDLFKEFSYDEQRMFLCCSLDETQPDPDKCESYKGLTLEVVKGDIQKHYPNNTICVIMAGTFRNSIWCPNRTNISHRDNIVIKVWNG
jgi:hypothetical protein